MWHSSLQQKTKQKAIPTNTAKRISPPTKKQPIHFSFVVLFERPLNPITERMKNRSEFSLSGSMSHKQVLRIGKCVVVGVLNL